MLTYTPYHYYFGIIVLCIIICMFLCKIKVNTSKKPLYRQSQTREESQEKACTTFFFLFYQLPCHDLLLRYSTTLRCLFQRQVNFCESNPGVSFILHRCWNHDEILWENMTRYNIPWWESPWSYPTSFSLFITYSKHQVQKWDFSLLSLI